MAANCINVILNENEILNPVAGQLLQKIEQVNDNEAIKSILSVKKHLIKLAKKSLDSLNEKDLLALSEYTEVVENFVRMHSDEELENIIDSISTASQANGTQLPVDFESVEPDMAYTTTTEQKEEFTVMFSNSLIHSLNKNKAFTADVVEALHKGFSTNYSSGIKALHTLDKVTSIKNHNYHAYEIKIRHHSYGNYRVYGVGFENKFYFFKMVTHHESKVLVNKAFYNSISTHTETIDEFLGVSP